MVGGYSEFIKKGDKMIENEVIQWLVDLDHYPTIWELQDKWGRGVIRDLLLAGDIILDENIVILTAITNPKLQKLVDESVRLK